MAASGDRDRWMTAGLRALELSGSMSAKSDAELCQVRASLTARYEAGESAALILPEAFGASAEAARRAIGYVFTQRDLTAGAALYDGQAVAIRDDGVNAVIATLPAFLAAITGEHIHLVTADEFVATRAHQQVQRICALLGLSIALAPVTSASLDDQQKAFAADVTVGSYLQIAYPYLANHLARDPAS